MATTDAVSLLCMIILDVSSRDYRRFFKILSGRLFVGLADLNGSGGWT